MTVPSVGKILNDAQVSLAVHKKCVKQMIQRRHADQDTFLPELCNAILPVLLEFKVRAPRLRPARRAADRRLPAVFRAPRPRVPSTLSSNTRDDTRGDLSPRSAFLFFALLCYVFVRLADAFPPLRPRPPPDSKSHAQRDLCAERVVRFLVGFTAARPEAREEEADDFAEAFLGFLLNLAGARDKAVRFRTCQIVAGVLNALGADAEISDDLYERMEEVMLERLRDKCAAVRAQAARALSRLQDGGDGGDFSDDKITQAFLTLLGAEKQPQVRKAILGSLAISDHTIPHVVERTRDAADDVRRVAYLALTSKVPVASVTIALRASAARRGLAERSPSVRAAAVEMLKRWHLAFEGDALALLAALDAESNEAVAEAVVKELIQCGKIKPAEVAASVADGVAPGGGLRRDAAATRAGWREDPSVLMTPEAAVYWRVVCEALHAAATQSGATAASAVGQNQVVSAAVAGERLESLEAALPASAADLLALVAAHADAGAVFVARQLLPLLSLLDLADATARRGARELVDAQLRAPPRAADDAHLDVAGAAASYALGGDGTWERALVAVLRAACEPDEVVEAVVSAADALRSQTESDAGDAQALFLVALLLERAPRASLSGAAAEAMTATLVRPGVTHASAAVRKEAVKVCGLLGVVRGVAGDAGETVRVLRAALAADAPAVRCVAARALGDLALLYGPDELDAQLDAKASEGDEGDAGDAGDEPSESEDAEVGPSLLFCPVTDALASVMDEPVPSDFAALDENAAFDVAHVDVTGGAAAAEAEREGCPGTAAAEALAKLVLRRGRDGFQNAAHFDAVAVVAKLLAQYLCADARARPRLAQCLAVFFPALASAPPDRRRLVADAALPCLRALSAEKGVARVGAYLAHLLDHAAAARAGGEPLAGAEPDAEDVVGAPRSRAYVAGGADLLRALCEEALATVSIVSAAATTTERALAKAYVAALASLAVAAPVAPAFTVADYDEKSVARATLVAAAEAAEAAAAKSTQKIASRDLKLAATKAREAAGAGAGAASATALGSDADATSSAPAAAKTTSMAEAFENVTAERTQEGIVEEPNPATDVDEAAEPAAPDTPGKDAKDAKAKKAASKTAKTAKTVSLKKTAKSKTGPVEEDEPSTGVGEGDERESEAPKPTRARSRRGALAENVAR